MMLCRVVALAAAVHIGPLFAAESAPSLLIAENPETETDASQTQALAHFSEGMVTLTFDDSWRSQYEVALPILKTAGIKATFYITTQPVQKGWPAFMTPTELKELAAEGHEIAGHTVSHPDLTRLPPKTLADELTLSKSYLETLTGAHVTSFAYPYGSWNSRVERAVKEAGYQSARGVRIDNLNTPASDVYNLKALMPMGPRPVVDRLKALVNAAKEKKRWFILIFHNFGRDSGCCSMSAETFQQIVDYIKSSGIKTVTVSEGVGMMHVKTAVDR